VSLMVAIFLLHFRSILRIIIEIPISVLLAFILMHLFGITSNIMSLGGIILAIRSDSRFIDCDGRKMLIAI